MAPPPGYYQRPTRGPSPWVPAAILGILLLIATTPYRMMPDLAMAYHPAARKPAGFISPALVWVPLILFFVVQLLGGNYRPYRYHGLGGYGGDLGAYPGGPDNVNYVRYYGGAYADRGGMSSFMDYGGHWLLIILGIWFFSLLGPGSAPVNTAAMNPRIGFPWSLFAPQPQVVMPLL